MQKITFEDTEVIKAPYVVVNGQEYPVQSQFEGGTDLNAETFNQLQDNVEEAIGEVQPEVWKDGPEGITYGFYLWEDDKKLGIVELFPTTVQSDNYFKPNMFVKFTNNGRTKYAKVIVAYLHHVWLYFGIQGGNILEDDPITNFKYSNEVIIDEAPRDLNTLYTNYAYDMVGFYNSQPVENPIQKYSTNEMVIGKWIDGKPLYRRVMSVTTPSSSGSWVNVGETLSNIDKVVNIDGVFYGGDGRAMSIEYGQAGWQLSVSYNPDASHMQILVGRDAWQNKSAYIIIEYTKSTDQALRGSQPNLSDLWNIPINGQEVSNGDDR